MESGQSCVRTDCAVRQPGPARRDIAQLRVDSLSDVSEHGERLAPSKLDRGEHQHTIQTGGTPATNHQNNKPPTQKRDLQR
jgi:hypothetical protein